MTSIIIWSIVAIIAVLAAIKLSHGRLLLFKAIQDYGYSDFRTISVLNEIVKRKLNNHVKKQNMSKRITNVSLYHEYGNMYDGVAETNTGEEYRITVKTDGFRVDYGIE